MKNEEIIKKSKLRLLSKKNFNRIYESIIRKKINYFDINEQKIEEILSNQEMEDTFSSISKKSSRKDALFEVKKSSETENSVKSSTGFSLIGQKFFSNYQQVMNEENNNFSPETKNSLDTLYFSDNNAKYFDFTLVEDEIFKNNDNKIIDGDLSLNNYENGDIFKGLFFN